MVARRRCPVPDLVVGDVRDGDVLAATVPGSDVVVHLAAKVGLGVDLDDVVDYVSDNDLGTAAVLRAAHRAGTGRIVLASSMVVYGEGAYDCPQHGRVAPGPRRVARSRGRRLRPALPAVQRRADADGGDRGRTARPAQRVCRDQGAR